MRYFIFTNSDSLRETRYDQRCVVLPVLYSVGFFVFVLVGFFVLFFLGGGGVVFVCVCVRACVCVQQYYIVYSH